MLKIGFQLGGFLEYEAFRLLRPTESYLQVEGLQEYVIGNAALCQSSGQSPKNLVASRGGEFTQSADEPHAEQTNHETHISRRERYRAPAMAVMMQATTSMSRRGLRLL